jgi:hypothetical protein
MFGGSIFSLTAKGRGMRKTLLASLAIIGLAAAPVFAFNSDNLNTITFENSTGSTLTMIVLSPEDSDYWGPEILGDGTPLKDDATASYSLGYADTSFDFDVKAVDDKGNEYDLNRITVDDGRQATIRITKKNLSNATYNYTLSTVRVTNSTGREIDYLFIPPSDSDSWGVDLLKDQTTLAGGDTKDILILVRREPAEYTLKAIDESNDEYDVTITVDPDAARTVPVSVGAKDMN